MIKDEVLKSFSGKSVLVTGGSGLIGRQLVDLLIGAGAFVHEVSLDGSAVVGANYVKITADLRDFRFCKEVTWGINYVFHLAGVKGSLNVTLSKPASFLVPMLMMNTNLLEACRINKVKKVLYTSSIGAYAQAEVFREVEDDWSRPPMDNYPGWAKRMGELQIRAYKEQYGLKDYVVVRPCNVYGPGDNFDPNTAMVIPSLIARIVGGKEDPLVIWGDGNEIRDFAYSRDVAEGAILAMYHGTKNYPFVNLGSGKGCTIRELVETLNRVLPGFDYEFNSKKYSGYPRRVMDISLAKELIDYNPTTSLLAGLYHTWEWYILNRGEQERKDYFKDEDRT